MKKKKQIKEKPKKRVKTVYRVLVNRQYQDFQYQSDARRHLITILEAGGVTFCSIEKVIEGR